MPQLPFGRNATPSSYAPRPQAVRIRLKTYSYDDRRVVLPALAEALERTGAWVLERRAVSLTEMAVRFEVRLRSALDLYAGLVFSGLEMTRESHQALTGLCTLRAHQRRRMEPFRMVEVEMGVSFLEEMELGPVMTTEAGRA